MHERSEHVQKHAIAMLLNDLENLHVHQGAEYDGAITVNQCGMVDLSRCLMRLVHGINEWKADMVCLCLELGQDGVSERFSGDAGSVRDKKYSALWHGGRN
jgi:hypothetical protein